MKKILLTGGNGFFGTRFTAAYKDKYEILSTHNLDIKDMDNVRQVFASFEPDYVIHAAAIANTEFCNKNPETARDINVKGAVNIASACKEAKSKLVFLSTEQVFNGNPESGPYTEEHKPIPDTMYGITKLEAEGLLKEMLDELWILRFTWLFGLPERNHGMSPNILWETVANAIKGKRTRVPCNEYRGLTYVHDIVGQFDKLFEAPYDTYHIGSHNNLSRYDIVCHILKEIGIGDRVEELIEKDTEKYAGHKRDARLNTNKIRQHGFAFADSDAALSKCITEFKLKV